MNRFVLLCTCLSGSSSWRSAYTSSLELPFHFWLFPTDVHAWLVGRVAVFRLAEEVGNAGGFFVHGPLRSLLSCLLLTPGSLALLVKGWPEPLGTTHGGVGWTVGKNGESPEIFLTHLCFLIKSIAWLHCHLLQSLLPGCTVQHWIREAKSFSGLETVQNCTDLHALR